MNCITGWNLREGKYAEYKEIVKQLAWPGQQWAALEKSDFPVANLEVCPKDHTRYCHKTMSKNIYQFFIILSSEK